MSATPWTISSGKPSSGSHMRIGSDSRGAFHSEGVERRQSGERLLRARGFPTPLNSELP